MTVPASGRPTLVLNGRDVRALLGREACLLAVEEAFRQHGTGEAQSPGVLGVPAADGGFHIKAGIMGPYFAAKVNGNFGGNEGRGLPRIQGVIVLCDSQTGTPLALLDSAEVTTLRTAAATAVAIKHLALPNAEIATICGCGVQAGAHLRALAGVRPLRKVFAVDRDFSRARVIAEQLTAELELEIVPSEDLKTSALCSQIVVTCTPSREAILFPDFVPAGAVVAAVGADSEYKQELDPALVARSTIVTDVTEQCVAIGDLHHALASGLVSPGDVHAQLGEIVAGKKPGRRSRDEIIVFDSTGMALQDVAASAAAYERARMLGRGTSVSL